MKGSSSQKKKAQSTKGSISKKDVTELHQLMAKNLYHTQKIERLAKKFDKFIFWIKVQTLIKVLIIVIPIILAYIFVVPKAQVFFDEIRTLYKTIIP